MLSHFSLLIPHFCWRGLRHFTSLCVVCSVLVACDSSDVEKSENGVIETPISETASSDPNNDACLTANHEVFTTVSGVEYLRTPDACFASLIDYDFAANYVEIDGLRMHYVDEGPADGEVVLMLHGQPSWSYLYRKMIPILAGAGYRVIAPDHIGMGKSDKPVDLSMHQYEQHVTWTKAFIDQMELTDINLFVQDWGSIIGLRVAGESSQHIARLAIANGDLFMYETGKNPYSYPSLEIDESLGDHSSLLQVMAAQDTWEKAFQLWIEYAAAAPELLAGDVIQNLTMIELSDNEVMAYNAPYPNIDYKAAIRAFPAMMTGIEMQNLQAWQTLGAYHNPFLFMGGEFDGKMGTIENQIKWVEHVPGADGNDHRRFPTAGHFIQDDVGEDLALHYLDFLQTSTPSEPLLAGGTFYNFRYCEILLSYAEGEGYISEVWGTPGLNLCPQEQWDAIDFERVAEDTGAIAVIPNGPRFFLMDLVLNADTVGSGGASQIRTFGDMQMMLLTTADTTNSEGEQQAYIEGEVMRGNTWVYYPGRRIYQLTDDSGIVYVMQSFSQISDSNLQVDDLTDLTDRLSLPEGWTYDSRVLDERLDVTAVDGIAFVLQDDLGNSYQRLP